MLVLARQKDQTVMIGDDVEVTVVDIRGDKVRLGINAPREVSVHRKEVYEAIRRENQAAAQVTPEQLAAGQARIEKPASANRTVSTTVRQTQAAPVAATEVEVLEVSMTSLRQEIMRLCESEDPDELRQGSNLFIQLADYYAKAA